MSEVKLSSTSASPAMARVAPAKARRKASRGLSSAIAAASAGSLTDHALRQILAEHALIIFRHGRALGLVAFVEEGQPEREADIVEDERVLRPADHGARAHHGGDVAIDEAASRQVRDLDHPFDLLPAALMVVLA